MALIFHIQVAPTIFYFLLQIIGPNHFPTIYQIKGFKCMLGSIGRNALQWNLTILFDYVFKNGISFSNYYIPELKWEIYKCPYWTLNRLEIF